MTTSARFPSRRLIAPSLALALFGGLATVGAACDPIPVFHDPISPGAPAGVIEGTVTYSGPPPCTRDGGIVGGAVLLAFDTRLLPPPEGLGTSAASVASVPGEQIFDAIRDQLVFRDDGALWCPSFDAPNVTLSTTWSIGPLAPAAYQIRGFYDHDGNFDPLFSIKNLPTRGDVGGGAIANVTEVLLGGAPRYEEFGVGDLQPDGTYTMPPQGVKVSGATVSLALVLDTDRPTFHVSKLTNNTTYEAGDETAPTLPSDFKIAVYNALDPGNTENSFVRLDLSAGVREDEIDAASKPPFELAVSSPAPTILHTREDANRDGVIDDLDTIPDSDIVKSLFPLAIFSKLGDDGLAQTSPVVILQGVTLLGGLVPTAFAPADLHDRRPKTTVALRPAAICLPADPTVKGVLVTTSLTDGQGNLLVEDEPRLLEALGRQFGREFTVKVGCLPEGRYAMNLVYPTGQAWTVPNEAGVCGLGEAPSDDGLMCGLRARLSSQAVVLEVVPGAGDCDPTPPECLALGGG